MFYLWSALTYQKVFGKPLTMKVYLNVTPSFNETPFLISMQCLFSYCVNDMSSFKSTLMDQKKSCNFKCDQVTWGCDMRWHATCNLTFYCKGKLWISAMLHLGLYYVLIKLFSFSLLGKMYKRRNTGYSPKYKFVISSQLARHKAKCKKLEFDRKILLLKMVFEI